MHQGKVYIEEVVLNSVDFSKDIFASCKFISDENLAHDLAAFVQEKGLLNRRASASSAAGATATTPIRLIIFLAAGPSGGKGPTVLGCSAITRGTTVRASRRRGTGPAGTTWRWS